MTPRGTAQTRREILELLRSEHGRRLRGVLHSADLRIVEVADRCATTHSKVSRWCDPESPETPSVVQVRMAGREVAIAEAQWILEPYGCHVVDHSRDEDSGESAIEMARDLSRLLAELVSLSSGAPMSRTEMISLRDLALRGRASMTSLARLLDTRIRADERLFSAVSGGQR